MQLPLKTRSNSAFRLIYHLVLVTKFRLQSLTALRARQKAGGRRQEGGFLVKVKPCCLAQLGLSPPPKSLIWRSSFRGGSESPSKRPPASCLSTPASFND